ncbi:hypothetical protein PR048_011167 [Dryococelus australis]|uniref:Uncharacterized protein n=1 Tax=Dryococelus australis TaxID=614101 RepID=A0ABQ9HKT3_9NEOP|nr:hypothetical protein PR048_011167 [Dryococelus australis]
MCALKCHKKLLPIQNEIFNGLTNIDGKLIKACKKSFLAVHGLRNNTGCLNHIVTQVKSGSMLTNDQWSKLENCPNLVSDVRVQAVHKQIRSIPTISLNTVKTDTLNLLQNTNTDKYFVMATTFLKTKRKRSLQCKKKIHLRRAEAIRDKLKQYTAKAKEGPEIVHTVSIDLQQTIPTSKLTCGHAFYLQKIWTYNVDIHDCSMDVGHGMRGC